MDTKLWVGIGLFILLILIYILYAVNRRDKKKNKTITIEHPIDEENTDENSINESEVKP